jgi:hypothetical protein
LAIGIVAVSASNCNEVVPMTMVPPLIWTQAVLLLMTPLLIGTAVPCDLGGLIIV